MASEEAAGLQHGELEEQLDVRGRELLRQLFQDRLDLTAAREERRHDVTGEDGVPRTRAEKGRTRPPGRYEVRAGHRVPDRVPGAGQAGRAPAGCGAEPAGGEALPRAAQDGSGRARRGSMGAACDAVARATGVRIGKRQLEELARRCAAHVEAFYLQRVISPAPDSWPLVLTFDGKGIVMLPGALRPATAKAAAAAEGLATRLSPGEKKWPQADGRAGLRLRHAAPVPRTPEEIISTPAQKRRKKKAQAGKVKGQGSRGSRRRGASG